MIRYFLKKESPQFKKHTFFRALNIIIIPTIEIIPRFSRALMPVGVFNITLTD